MSAEWWPILWVSLKVATITSVFVMGLSLWLGWLFARSNSRILSVAETLVYLPMAMPPVALGFGLLVLLGPRSWLGHFLHEMNIDIAFTFAGAIVASSVASLGIGVRTMRTAFLLLNPHYAEVARLHGANRMQTFRFIILPLLWPSLVSGTILVFIRALGEFGATMVLAGNTLGQTRTLALAIWTDMQTPGKEVQAWSLVLLAAFLSFLALRLSELVSRQGPVGIFSKN